MQQFPRRRITRIGSAAIVLLVAAALGCSHTVRRPIAEVLADPANRLETPDGEKISGFDTADRKVPLMLGRARVQADSVYFRYTKFESSTYLQSVRQSTRVPADTAVARAEIANLWLVRPNSEGTVGLILVGIVISVGLFVSAFVSIFE